MEYLVIDSGGTFIKYAVMNENADILEKGKVKTPDHMKHTLEDYLVLERCKEWHRACAGDSRWRRFDF